MDFEKFKERYIAKLMKSGLYKSEEEITSDPDFNDRMAELYLGLMVYSEYQNEVARAQYEQMKKQQKQQEKPKSNIYVPNKGMH